MTRLEVLEVAAVVNERCRACRHMSYIHSTRSSCNCVRNGNSFDPTVRWDNGTRTGDACTRSWASTALVYDPGEVVKWDGMAEALAAAPPCPAFERGVP